VKTRHTTRRRRPTRKRHYSHAQDRKKAVELALGRIFRMGSRPTRPGDVEEYERCRAIILDNTEPSLPDYRSNYARDRLKGAQGD
jgi:hypothetical protein